MELLDRKQLIALLEKETLLVGSLSTSQQVKLGKSKSGKPIFQIQPFKKIYPPFWITYGGQLKGKIIIAFKFKDWPDDSKLPFAESRIIIGTTNDSKMFDILTHHYQLGPMTKIPKTFSENCENFERKDLSDLDIFSIDPDGCEDIDDCLSFEDDQIGVHIAQPIYWLTKDQIIERANYSFATLYASELENKNFNLWGTEITHKASLAKNEKKPAYSIFFKIKDNKIIGVSSSPTWVVNKNNTTYDHVTKVINPKVQALWDITQKISGTIMDSHELVSYWMVKTNNYIG
jgi:exoribonuclease R